MSGLERAISGDELSRKALQEGPSVLPVENPQVQVYLAKLAFPDATKPMNNWLLDNDYSSRFRAYIEDPARIEAEKHVDITDPQALAELLEAVRVHAPETIH